jgi:hypothetical protein
MSNSILTPSRWRTASFGQLADTLPTELADLGTHLGQCQRSSGRWVKLQCAGHATSGFVHTRVVTSLLVVAALVGAAYLLR